MERNTKTNKETEQTGSYLQIIFSRAPKKNHDALARLGKRWAEQLKNKGARTEIYYLNRKANRAEGYTVRLKSITDAVSIDTDEELEVSLQFYKDRAHADRIYSKTIQDETYATIAKEFDQLV